MTQRKIRPTSELIYRVFLPRPEGIYQCDTYHCLQCSQRIVDHSGHGVTHGRCRGCGRCFTGKPAGGFNTDNPLIVGSDHRLCGNCYWRLSVPCGCACGCSQARLPTFPLCHGCSLSAKFEMWKVHRVGEEPGVAHHPVCSYILGGHRGTRLAWERHLEDERKAERTAEEAIVREREERAERWRNADRIEREAMLSERRSTESTQG